MLSKKNSTSVKASILFSIGLFLAVFLGWFIANFGITAGVMLAATPIIFSFITIIFYHPRYGFIVFIVYGFLLHTLSKHHLLPQAGLGLDAILLLIWLAVIFYQKRRFRFRHLNNDLVWLPVAWLALTILEIGNPEGPSIVGWIYEMRSIALYWVLTIPLCFLVFNKKNDLDLFLHVIISLSILGTIWGVKQFYFGVDAAEQQWLDEGAKKTHVLFGKLRVFSYYSEAAQFGASQAQLALMCIVLAAGPYSPKRKIFYSLCAAALLYGMLISGTRGALFALVSGAFAFLALSKQIKILIIGSVLALGFLFFLKYTHIGNGNAEIVRLRTSVDPKDLSFQARMANQATLRSILSTKPFGAGVGTVGMWGKKYNQHLPISRVPPDSFFVKVWANYGIVGFTLWLSIMAYITGKSAGIIWNTKDAKLRNKLICLCAGTFGIIFCSYGNEVMNQTPSSIILYVSWAFIWLSPRWDKATELSHKTQLTQI